MYVAGTKSIRDAYDDLHILVTQTSHSERYQTPKQYLDTNPEVNELVGHSFGGSVMLAAQSNYHKENGSVLHTTTHGAPVLSNDHFSDKKQHIP